MLERGDRLLTWQLPRAPVDSSLLPMSARHIADHRKVYLDYEGTISGDRGEVRRVDCGLVKFHEVTPSSLTVTLSGQRISGRFTLQAATTGPQLQEDTWVFSAATPAT